MLMMLGTPLELLLVIVIAALAGAAALFAALCFFRMQPQGSALTEQTAGQLLRTETDKVYRSGYVIAGSPLFTVPVIVSVG